MKIGIIGLGKMGYSIAQNAQENGHDIIGYDINRKVDDNIKIMDSIDCLLADFNSERKIIWLMLPAGEITNEMIDTLTLKLNNNDIIIDGGNSNYKDTIKSHELCQSRKIDFIDVGTSGGITGARNGACMMIGGDYEVFKHLEPLFRDINVQDGYAYMGKGGSGHYVKMVHNGIEYAMMGAIGEGFEILQASEFDLDNEAVAKVWANGSVIRSWLMDLTLSAFEKDPNMDNITGVVNSSGEGLWTVQEALDTKVPAILITNALLLRYRSQQEDTYSGKVVAALRDEFGGHGVVSKDENE